MNKKLILLFCIVSLFWGSSLYSEENGEEQNEINNIELQLKNIKMEISEIKRMRQNDKESLTQYKQNQKNMYEVYEKYFDKTMENVKLAIQGANRSTTFVSIFAITFTILTILLGLFGFHEITLIKKIRVGGEKALKLTKHLGLGLSYTQAVLFQQAIKEFENVVEIDPDNDLAYSNLGYLYLSVVPRNLG